MRGCACAWTCSIERKALVDARDEGEITNAIVLVVERDLDLEEERRQAASRQGRRRRIPGTPAQHPGTPTQCPQSEGWRRGVIARRVRGVAEAAQATRAQGRFEAMHDALFAHRKALEDADLARYAEEIGLDMERFHADMASRVHVAAIEAERAEGERLGVTGTPGLFIDGERYTGVLRLRDAVRRLRPLTAVGRPAADQQLASRNVAAEEMLSLKEPVSAKVLLCGRTTRLTWPAENLASRWTRRQRSVLLVIDDVWPSTGRPASVPVAKATRLMSSTTNGSTTSGDATHSEPLTFVLAKKQMVSGGHLTGEAPGARAAADPTQASTVTSAATMDVFRMSLLPWWRCPGSLRGP
jgi:DSBA-like thioredoxin domain